MFCVAAGFGGVGGEVGETDDGVEGGAEFVGDVGEEFGFETAGFEEIDVGLSELADAGVEGAVGGFELILGALERAEHGVESFGEVLEFVAGGDGGADFEIAGGDFFGGVFQDAHRLEDEAGGDEVKDDDGERSADHSGDDDDDAIEEELVFVGLVRDIDADDADDGPGCGVGMRGLWRGSRERGAHGC